MRSLHTPQQETNVAYNPGVSYRGGEFIAQGISQAGNAITAGLQRYAQNREESAALDMSFQTRAQPLLEEMQKFSAKDGQVSPAAGLVDKGADWHKFSSSQKKAFLADVVIMGDKQDRARRQQQEDDFRKAAQQFQQDQLTATERHRRVVEEQGAALALQSARNQDLDNLRLDKRLTMDEQNFANLQEARRAKLQSDTLMAGNLAQFQRLAAEPTGPSRMGGDLAASLFSQPGTGLPDISRYGPQDTQLTQQPLSMERVAQLGVQTGAWQNPQFNDLAKLYQGVKLDPIGQMNAEAALSNAKTNAAEAARRASSGGGAALPEPRDGYAAFPDGRGGHTWKAQKKADGSVSAAIPAEMQTKMDTLLNEITEDEAQIAAGDTRSWYGGSRADRLKENKARLAVYQRNYGGAAASGPASGGSRFKVEEIK